MCMTFGYNPQINFVTFFSQFEHSHFWVLTCLKQAARGYCKIACDDICKKWFPRDGVRRVVLLTLNFYLSTDFHNFCIIYDNIIFVCGC